MVLRDTSIKSFTYLNLYRKEDHGDEEEIFGVGDNV